LYAHLRLSPAAGLELDDDHAERAVYVAAGSVRLGGHDYSEGTLVVLRAGDRPRLESLAGADAMLLGGAPLDGDRHIYWNFVSSSRQRLEQAKADWQNGRFGKVVGDETEFIPLPSS
jgi:redox-sensitive bicupin YhaK (pirin superfamily)